jgi:hypothetical protein
LESDSLITMKTSLTEFQRNFRKAREAANRGDRVIVKGEKGEYLLERRSAPAEHPFVGLEGVFGAVKLPRDEVSLRKKIRPRLGKKSGKQPFENAADVLADAARRMGDARLRIRGE